MVTVCADSPSFIYMSPCPRIVYISRKPPDSLEVMYSVTSPRLKLLRDNTQYLNKASSVRTELTVF
jgi:hypothetical protein